MRLERLTNNKIKIILSIDDLTERGLTKEDIWKDSWRWYQLFQDMLMEAGEQLGIDLFGAIAVIEILSVQAHELVMLVSVEEHDDELFSDFILDMKMTPKEEEGILFEFAGIEEVIQLSKRLKILNVLGGTLYGMDEKYFLFLSGASLKNKEGVVANIEEFGRASEESIHRLDEYGNKIINGKAVETLIHYFS